MIDHNYLLLTLFLVILVIYLILPVPSIIFRLKNNHIVNIEEQHDCDK